MISRRVLRKLLGPVLDALKACGVKATFFVIADFCSTYARRQLLGRAVRDGVEAEDRVITEANPVFMY